MTPTELAAVQRHKDFHAHIARKAAELEAKNAPKEPDPIDPTPSDPPWLAWIKGAEEAPVKGALWFSLIDDLGPRSEPSIALIQQVCCRHFALTRKELLAQRRKAELVYARQLGMFVAKLLTTKSLPEIGRRFGNRDHTTVLYAVRKIGLQSKQDPEVACDINALKAEIERYAP